MYWGMQYLTIICLLHIFLMMQEGEVVILFSCDKERKGNRNQSTQTQEKAQCLFCCCSATKSLTLRDLMDCSISGFPIHHRHLELAQSHVHWVNDAIQSSHPLSFPSLPAFNVSHHQDLFKWLGSSHQVAKVLEFQLQHQSFQWIFRTDFL